jgi:hypothetical protein
VVPVHRPLRLVDPRVVLPRRRHEERHRLPDVEARPHEELERVVEQRRIGSGAVERGREGGIEPPGPLAGLHPLDVPLDRVDLAVVAEEAERLRPLPARLGVRREALVEDRPRGGPRRVGEVGIEARELRGGAERLVRHRAERDRRDVDAVDTLGPAAGTVRAQLRVRLGARREHELDDPRHVRRGGRAERGDIVRDVAPPERLEALRATRLLDDPPQPRLAQEAHRHAGALVAGQRGVQRQQQARAVARDPVRRPRAAVRDGGEARERAVDELARRAPVRVGNEPDAAGVALGCRVVELVCHGGWYRLSCTRR